MTDEKNLTVDDLLAMNHAQLTAIMMKAHPIDLESLDETMYLGVDLSLPKVMNMILWKTFRKTFHRDPETGDLRGWNVRMEQTGWDGPGTPMTKDGKQIAFGHYKVMPTTGVRFPKDWNGKDYLDYGIAGNAKWDVAALGYCPLVQVNKDSSDLLMGWEIFKLGPLYFPLPDYWALQKEGPLDEVVAVPCP